MSAAHQMVVQLTVEELEQLVDKAVRKAVAPPDTDVLTRDQVAKMLRVNERTVVNYVEQHGLPATRLPNGWRFFRSEVIAWMKGRK